MLSLSLTAVAQTTAPASSTGTIPARVNLDPAPTVLYGGTAPVVIAPSTPNTTIPARVNLDPVPPILYRADGTLMPSGPDPSVVRPLATSDSIAVDTGVVTAGGGVTYVSEPVASTGPMISVADAAAQYRTSRAGVKSRVIDNNTLSTLDRNPSGLVTASEMTMPQGAASAGEAAALYNAKPEYAAAGDVLDPRDLAAVEAAIRRTEMLQNTAGSNPNDTGAQYEQMTQAADAAEAANASADALPQGDQAEVIDPQATRTEAMPEQSEATAAVNDANEAQRERLPESSSALPFLGLLGFIAVAGGAVSMLRARG
ncbi:MAG: hypothetical protein ABIP81_04385 [Terriglobales bacterium]